jgi:hypothetical protein
MTIKNKKDWERNLRAKIFAKIIRLFFYCEACGKTPGALIIHHKDFNKDNDKPENLELLCPYCYCKKHWERKIENDD